MKKMKVYQHIRKLFVLLLATVLLLCACGESVPAPDADAGKTSQKQEEPGNEAVSSKITDGVLVENKENGCILSVQDGVYALELPEGTAVEENSDRMANSAGRGTSLIFSTPEEFCETMQTMNFTEEQMATMREKFVKTEDGKVKLFDVTHLYQPNFSEEFAVSGVVVTSGTYSYGVASENVTVRLDVEVKADFDQRFYVGYTNMVEHNSQWISVQQKEGEWNGVPATIYQIETDMESRLKVILYELSIGVGTMYVREAYVLQSELLPESVSEDVPLSTELFVETEAVRYICYINSDHALTAAEIRAMTVAEIS